MRDTLKRRAAELLPACLSLEDAERVLGGAFRNNERDRAAAAVTWGLWDGFRGRPQVSIKGFERDYDEAYEVGRGFASVGLPSGRKPA